MPAIRRPRTVALAPFVLGRLVLAAGLAAAVLAQPSTGHARIFAQWVQVGPDGTSSVRASTEEACPQVVYDGTPTPMNVRAEPGVKIDNVKPAQFPVRSCEVAVPAGAVAATVDGKALPLVRPNP